MYYMVEYLILIELGFRKCIDILQNCRDRIYFVCNINRVLFYSFWFYKYYSFDW